MLAGIGSVLMGAGIPLHIPGVLDAFADHPKPVELCMVANLVAVLLAREGHANPVGNNFLEKAPYEDRSRAVPGTTPS
jgi:hypothetical protein